jgi:hypothetical protein
MAFAGYLSMNFRFINGDVPLLEKTFFDLLRRNGTEHPAIASDFGSEFDIDMLKAFSQFLRLRPSAAFDARSQRRFAWRD